MCTTEDNMMYWVARYEYNIAISEKATVVVTH